MNEPIYAVVDVETTGTDFENGDRIIQVGCVIVKGQEIINSYDMLIQPERPIPKEITALTKISNHDVQDAMTFEEVAPFLHQMLSECIFVAHGATFDFHFINESFKMCGFPSLEVSVIDTVELAQVVYPEINRYKLSLLAQDLNISLKHAHSAFYDAYATAEILIKCEERIRTWSISFISEIIRHQEAFLSDNVIFFEGIQKSIEEKGNEHSNHLVRIFPKLWINQTFFNHLKLLENQSIIEKNDKKDSFSSAIHLMKHHDMKHDALKMYELAKEEPLLIVSSDQALKDFFQETDVTVNQLHAAYHYIHLEKFYDLFNRFKQQSRFSKLTLLACFVWLSLTEDGCLKELGRIPRDQKIVNQIACRPTDTYTTYNAYGANLLKSQQATVLLISPTYFLNYGPLFKRRMIIHHINDLKKRLVHYQTIELNMHELQKFVDELSQAEQQHIKKNQALIINQHIKQLNQLLNGATISYHRLIDEQSQITASFNDKEYVYCAQQVLHQSELFDYLERIQKTWEFIQSFLVTEQIQKAHLSLKSLKKLLTYDSRYILELSKDLLNIRKILVLPEQLLIDQLNQYPGDKYIFYFDQQEVNFFNDTINESKNEIIDPNMRPQLNIINKEDALSNDREKEELHQLYEQVITQYQANTQATLIVCSSQKSIEYLYHLLKVDYFDQLLALNMTGKPDVILKSIDLIIHPIILTTPSLLSMYNWSHLNIQSIFIAKLPFAYMDDPLVHATREYYHLTHQNFFKEWYFPQMIHSLRRIFYLTNLNNNAHINYWLFDSRLNKKTYRIDFLKVFRKEFQIDTF
ncbi:exonuclease domain-containing protein [Atopobacter phocae]|uniref:exonuclease domain-containing protein n=1 Tax=Atopobacter phocae TaxID=136492 RepID=UPI0004724DFB|nr:exonuclease domain-containing protein [Atopobacter phocae]